MHALRLRRGDFYSHTLPERSDNTDPIPDFFPYSCVYPSQKRPAVHVLSVSVPMWPSPHPSPYLPFYPSSFIFSTPSSSPSYSPSYSSLLSPLFFFFALPWPTAWLGNEKTTQWKTILHWSQYVCVEIFNVFSCFARTVQLSLYILGIVS